MRRTTTVATENAGRSKKKSTKTRKKQPALEDPTPSDLERRGQSDSDDEAIERGVTAAKSLAAAKGKKRKRAPSPPLPSPSELSDVSPLQMHCAWVAGLVQDAWSGEGVGFFIYIIIASPSAAALLTL